MDKQTPQLGYFILGFILAGTGAVLSILLYMDLVSSEFIFGLTGIFVLLAGLVWYFTKPHVKAGNTREGHQAVSELAALFDTAVDSIIYIDPKGDIRRFNKAAEGVFGYQKEEVLGKNVKLLMPDHYADQHDKFLSDYQLTGQKKIIGIGRTVIGLRKNGTQFPMDLSVGELPPPINGYVGIIRDVSERVESESRLLNHARDLARSNEDLAQFAYIASHDLKAPLRAIDNLAGWIDEKVGQFMDEECQEYMQLLRSRVNRLDQLLSSLLEYSRIGQQEQNHETLSLNSIIKNVIDLMDVEQFSIEMDDFPDIFASKTEIEILFRNLIGNSIKHHDRNEGRIRVAYNRREQHHEFSVHDNGPGIPPDMSSKIFTMFQTLQPRDTVEGSGMGLAFVKKITERNNASVLVGDSCFDRGAAIIIRWPSKKGEANEIQRSHVAAGGG
ncbi:MAG: PAS domain S-box protein [Sneathiellales bacterium]|nr:PAS domain S-box protein [Sneathiellales bacterium]